MVWLVFPLFLLVLFLIFFLIGYFSTPTDQDKKITKTIITSLKKDRQYDLRSFLFHWVKAKFNWNNFLLGVAVLLTFVPLMIVTHAYTIIDYDRFIFITIALSIMLSIVIYFKIKPDILNMLGYVIAVTVYTYLSIKAINIYADKTAPSLYIGTVVSKESYKYHRKSHEFTSYILRVRASDGNIRYVEVVEKFYDSLDKNDQVKMRERNGAIGLRWIEDVKL